MMSPRLRLPQEDSDLIALELQFIRDFVDFVHIIKKSTCSSSLRSPRKICMALFDNFTRNFFDKWKNIPEIGAHLEWQDHYALELGSFGFKSGNKYILVPHLLVSRFMYGIGLNVRLLSKVDSIQELFTILLEVFDDSNLSLNTSDLKIIRYYTNADFYRRWSRFPSQTELARELGMEQRTISTRSRRLYDLYILSHTYLINMARLGYQTLAYVFPNPSNLSNAHDYCLGILPFNIGFKTGRLGIFQIPFKRHDIFSDIEETYQPIEEFELHQGYLGWFLSPLKTRPQDRWNQLPPILRENRWSDEIILDHSGFSYDLLPDFDPVTISPKQAKLLSFYYSRGSVKDTQLAKHLGVNKDTVRQLWRDLIQNKLLIPYSIVSNIGLDISIWVLLISQLDQVALISRVADHLCHFPFIRIMYSSNILVGSITLPSKWLKAFSSRWKELECLGFYSQFGIMDDQFHIQRGLDIAKTMFPGSIN